MARKMIIFAAFLALVAMPKKINAWTTEFYNYGKRIATDAFGNTYVLGSSNLFNMNGMLIGNGYCWINKYDSEGKQVWTCKLPYGAQSLALNALGNAYVVGTGEDSATNGLAAWTIKIGPNGNRLWEARYLGPANRSYASDVAIDSIGNVYMTGYSDGVGHVFDYATVKYDSAGNELWVARYDDSNNGADYAQTIAIDEAGNTYVTGYANAWYPNTPHYATVKYDPAGSQLWVVTTSDIAYWGGNPPCLAIDTSSNVYLSGGTGACVATIKYDSAGNERWIIRESRIKNSPRLAIDAGGNILVTGYGVSGYLWTFKYDSGGNELWEASYTPLRTNIPEDMVVDAGGNVYIATIGYPLGGAYYGVIIKYNSGGNLIWDTKYSGNNDEFGWPYALTIDALGNVYVTGEQYIGGFSFYSEYLPVDWVRPDWHNFNYNCSATEKFNSLGQEEWSATYENAEDMINLLIYYVGQVDSKNGVQGMTSKLEAAQASYQEAKAHDYVNTINQLEAFKNKCDADSMISENDRFILKSQADWIIAYLKTKT